MFIVQQVLILLQIALAAFLVGNVQRKEVSGSLRLWMALLGAVTLLSGFGYLLMSSTTDPAIATVGALLILVIRAGGWLGPLGLLLLQVFFSDWRWQRRISWVVIGVLLAIHAFLVLDALFGWRLIITGAPAGYAGGYTASSNFAEGSINWLLRVVDITAFLGVLSLLIIVVRRPQRVQRRQATILLLSLFGGALTLPLASYGFFGGAQLLLLLALSEVVIRRQLLMPRQVALDAILRSNPYGTMVLSNTGECLYHNPAFEQILGRPWPRTGRKAELLQLLAERQADPNLVQTAIEATTTSISELRLRNPAQIIELRAIPVRIHQDQPSVLLVFRDMTAAREREAVREALFAEQDRLLQTVRQLSSPFIPLYDQVVLVPLVGTLDGARIAPLLVDMTTQVHHYRASWLVFELTGVDVIAENAVEPLIDSIRAINLLGCQVVVVGLRSALALALAQHPSATLLTYVARDIPDALRQISAQQPALGHQFQNSIKVPLDKSKSL